MPCDIDIIRYFMRYDMKTHNIYDDRNNFYISKFGAYEVRGWNLQPDYDSALRGDFLFIGVIIRKYSSEESKRACRILFDRLIEDGKFLGKISPDYDARADGHVWGLT